MLEHMAHEAAAIPNARIDRDVDQMRSRMRFARECSATVATSRLSSRRRRSRVYRRDFLKTAAAVALPLWGSSRLLSAQQPAVASRRLTDSLAVLDVGGRNVLCSSANPQGLVLVDSGAPQVGESTHGRTPDCPSGCESTNSLQHALSRRSDGQQRNVRRRGRKDHRARAHAAVDVDRLLGSGRKSLREGSPQSRLAHGNLPHHRLVESGNRTDRLRPPASGPHRRRHLHLFQRLRMFWRLATWPLRFAIRLSTISPERGSAVAWTRWT